MTLIARKGIKENVNDGFLFFPRRAKMIPRALFYFYHALAVALILALLSTAQRWRFGFPIKVSGFLFPVIVGATIGLLVGYWREKIQQKNRQLVDREERFRHLYQQTPVMLHSIDADGRLLAVSDCWLQEMGYRIEEVLGSPITNFFSADSRQQFRAAGNLADRLMTGSLREIPLQMVRRDGRIIEGLFSAVAELDKDGNLVRGQAVLVDVTERTRAEREVEKLAYFDSLTGLPNRLLLQDRLHQALAQARRHESCGAVLFLDLDRFKNINDTLGHHVGDRVLKVIADRLTSAVREGDTVARLGGDEFIVLLPEFRDDRNLAAIGRKILQVVSSPLQIDERNLVISTSIGISVFPTEAGEAETLLRHADLAMYAAKEEGRNTFCFFSREMNERVTTRLQMETDLRRALELQEFELYYQPQLDLDAGRIIGAEVLLRWFPPGKDPIPPASTLDHKGVSNFSLIYKFGRFASSSKSVLKPSHSKPPA